MNKNLEKEFTEVYNSNFQNRFSMEEQYLSKEHLLEMSKLRDNCGIYEIWVITKEQNPPRFNLCYPTKNEHRKEPKKYCSIAIGNEIPKNPEDVISRILYTEDEYQISNDIAKSIFSFLYLLSPYLPENTLWQVISNLWKVIG